MNENDRKRNREGMPVPAPSFGSVVGVLSSLPAVVDALQKVKENADRCAGKLAATTSLSVACTVRLLDEQPMDGESKRDREERLELGKKYALLVLALLVDGDNHVGGMDCLNNVLTSDPSRKSIAKVLEGLCLTDAAAALTLKLAADCLFVISELAMRIPKDNQSVEVVLTLGHHFGSCKVWCPSGSPGKGFDRHIAVDPLYDATVEGIRSVIASNRAALVCGESGSGKTFSSVLSAGDGICIYLTANDLIDTEARRGALYDSLEEDADEETQEVAAAARGSKPALDQQRHCRRTLTSALETLVRGVASCVGSEFAGPVVLVVDEVGSHPLLVRGLCREAKDMVQLLRGNLRLTGTVGVVVSGTGSESGGEALGSYPETYSVIACEQKAFTEHVIQLIDVHGFRSLAGLLRNKPIATSHHGNKLGLASSLFYVQRLLTNRRFAAALLVQLKATFAGSLRASSVTSQLDASVPWLTVLPWLTSAALLQFKALNSMSGKSFDVLRGFFADALAICFGGHLQVSCATSRMLHRDFGMIVDNARSVLHADAELMVPGDCLDKRYVLALPKQRADEHASGTAPHFGRRFGMGPATLEMGLQGFSLSTAARARSGDGLEHTMADFLYCWALACCSSVAITLPGEVPPGSAAATIPDEADHDGLARRALVSIMAEVRDEMRKEKVSVVLRARLTKSTETVQEAVAQAFEIAQEMIHENGVPFVIVVHTAPLAPFADVVVVVGVTPRGAREPRVPTMFVAVHLLTATAISPWDALREHLKQGCPVFDTEGGQAVAKMIRKEDMAMLAKARALLKAASASYKSPYPFVSLVLAVCPEEFAYTEDLCAVEEFAAMTTVRIRRGVLRSVVHPIPLGSDPQCSAVSCFDDCVTTSGLHRRLQPL